MSARPRRRREEGAYTSRGAAWEWKQSWFLLLFPTVYLYWAPLVYMGLRVARPQWVFYGLAYAAPGLIYLFVKSLGAPPEADAMAASLHDSALRYARNATGAFAIFSLLHTLRARTEFLVRLEDDMDDTEEVMERAEAVAVDGEVPVARGRLNPNRLTETELAMLPGFGPERAKRALEVRASMGDYRSFADFAHKLKLPDALRQRLEPMFEEDSGAVAPAVRRDDPAYRELPDGTRVVEVNWASAEALAGLPGLTPELAAAAVAVRDADGPYKSLEDFRFRLGLSMDALIKLNPHLSAVQQAPRPADPPASRPTGRIVDV